MGAVPKKKTTHQTKGKRRSQIKLDYVNTTTCPKCNSPKLPHQACPECGFYK